MVRIIKEHLITSFWRMSESRNYLTPLESGMRRCDDKIPAYRYLNIVLCTLLLVLSTSISLAANITASIDRNPVQLGESFQLILEVDGSPDDDPDLSPLNKDFDIQGRSQSSSIQIINGQMTNKVQWILTLMPKHTGEVTIPAVHFGSDRSNPVKISISETSPAKPGARGEEIFIEVDADPNESWVQAQIIYTVRLYRTVTLNNASLTDPGLSDADAVVEKLGEDSEFDTMVNGKRYRVIERKYAIFPQQSGKLTIEPVVFNGQIILSSSRFSMDPFSRRAKNKQLRSKSVSINIKPAPEALKKSAWLPASHVKLTEEWPDTFPEFKVGEAVTRTLRFEATGLTAAQLPELSSQQYSGFKTYPDQPHLENTNSSTGVTGARQEKIALIPTKPGTYVLPEIRITWWNTKTNQKETAILPQKDIVVMPADNQQVAQATPLQDAQKSANEVREAPAPTDGPPENTVTPDNNITHTGYWPWISLALAIGWLLTLLLVWNKISIKRNEEPGNERAQREESFRKSQKDAERKLKQACTDNDAAAAKEALLLWGKSIFPDNPPSSITALGDALGGGIVEHINNLSMALYSKTKLEWNGKNLWESAQAYNKGNSRKPENKKELLAPMYPG